MYELFYNLLYQLDCSRHLYCCALSKDITIYKKLDVYYIVISNNNYEAENCSTIFSGPPRRTFKIAQYYKNMT